MRTQLLKRDMTAFAGVLIFSLLLFNTVSWYEEYLYHVILRETFITWHLLLEFASIIMSTAIFLTTLYTSEKSYRLRTIIISCTFLAVALLDTFHTLSYKGMPIFLTDASIAKATTFWILARLMMSFGLLAASLIPYHKKNKNYRNLFPLVTLVLCIIMLYAVTYHLEYFPSLFIEGVGLTPLKVYLEYVIISIQLIIIFIFIKAYLYEKEEEGYIYIIIGLLISIFSEIAFTMYSNVYDTYNLLGHVYKIIAYYLFFKALFVQNVQKPYRDLHEAERKISLYADNLEKLVLQRTSEIGEANEKIMMDLDHARNIQRALLPTNFPKVGRLDFSVQYVPCEKIGGDFYNVYKLDDDNIGILIGDVAGHGVSAAMVTVFINQNINIRREYDDGRIKVLSPKQVLTNLYHIYNRMSFPDEVYTVMFYGIYNLQSGVLTYTSAGMNTSPLILSKEGEISAMNIDGLPICMLGTHVNPNYENKSLQLKGGDRLIFYTDGLIELDRKMPEIFNEENLMEFLKGIKDVSAKDISEQMMEAYYSFLGDKKMIDDVTILVVSIPTDGV